jgi:type VI protein secretion system component Hcp
MQWSFGAALGIGVALALTGPAVAAVDAYLRIDGTPGTSPSKPGWIELRSWRFGAGRGMAAPTGEASDRQSSAPGGGEIKLTKAHDATSPLLRQCAANGCHYGKAEIIVRKAGEQAYLRYQLTDVMISSYQSGSGERTPESVTLKFSKIELQSQGQQPERPAGQGGQRAMTPSAAELPPPGPRH